MEVAIIDFGAGNIHSLKSAIEKIISKDDVRVCKTAQDIGNPTHIILPGVGSYDNAINNLRERGGLISRLEELVARKKVPFLGICVGMQILSDKGYENKESKGLGWIGGEVREFVSDKYKIPHMGWNNIKLTGALKPEFEALDGQDFYFVHSYFFSAKRQSDIGATTGYIVDFPAMLSSGNILATQFHPEKSSDMGLLFLKIFLKRK
jgi:imidazole glycerol-phosphate synthase subunit HisH